MWFVVAAVRRDTGLLLSPKINGRHSADYICKSRYISSIFWCQFRRSLLLWPKWQSLAQVMAWRVTGDKSLPEKMETWCTSVFMRLSLSISEGTRYYRHENGVFALYLLNVIFLWQYQLHALICQEAPFSIFINISFTIFINNSYN